MAVDVPGAGAEIVAGITVWTAGKGNRMGSTNVNVTRDEQGNVVAHWVGTVTFDPGVYGDHDSYHSLINECVENFKTELQAEIYKNFTT